MTAGTRYTSSIRVPGALPLCFNPTSAFLTKFHKAVHFSGQHVRDAPGTGACHSFYWRFA